MSPPGLSWLGIVRLGLVQTALGSIVVLMTSTLNRVMVVELALAALLPGVLVGIHYAVELLRPRWGYGSDMGGRRTPWIIGGMALLAVGAVIASSTTLILPTQLWLGMAIAILAFVLIGIGVGASGTSLLALITIRTDPGRRAAAATIVWLMMIAGIAITAGVAGALLDPFSIPRLIAITAGVAGIALTLTVLAVWGVEPRTVPVAADPEAPHRVAPEDRPGFFAAMREVWADQKARRFSVFVFVSMLAFSAPDLVLEPFAGAVFGYTPGESTQLTSTQHQGVFLGMILVGVIGSVFRGRPLGSLTGWTVFGCAASGAALIVIASGGVIGPAFPLKGAVFALGMTNGMFAVAAIGSMMALAGANGGGREGTRLGFWGAAQAAAFGFGGLLGTGSLDAGRLLLDSAALPYTLVFLMIGTLFFWASALAWWAARPVAAPAVAAGPTPVDGQVTASVPRSPPTPALPSLAGAPGR